MLAAEAGFPTRTFRMLSVWRLHCPESGWLLRQTAILSVSVHISSRDAFCQTGDKLGTQHSLVSGATLSATHCANAVVVPVLWSLWLSMWNRWCCPSLYMGPAAEVTLCVLPVPRSALAEPRLLAGTCSKHRLFKTEKEKASIEMNQWATGLLVLVMILKWIANDTNQYWQLLPNKQYHYRSKPTLKCNVQWRTFAKVCMFTEICQDQCTCLPELYVDVWKIAKCQICCN